MTQQHHIKYRHDYRAPDYTITDIDLTFALDAATTRVTAVSQVKRLGDAQAELRLDGEALTLIAIEVDGLPWSAYRQEEGALVLSQLPEQFQLKIVNDIHPDKNTALEGLYQSGEALCTQCEAEGFRHITWYLDRPDVLARFTTTIIADEARYPYLLSNGNRIDGGKAEQGKHWVKWQDPFPKPCYLFALVAGDFDVLRDSFKTRSGRDVALEIFVDRGNLDRADWAMTSLKNSMKWDEEFSSDLGSRAVNRIDNVRVMRGAQFAEDASPMAHPIRPDQVMEMNNFYTLTVYEKGSEVIRMMHTLLGEENFQKGMQLYFERHDGSAATCDDFVQAMEDASNVDLSQFRRWYSQSGTPVLTVRDDYNPELEQYTLHVTQHTPPTADQKEKLPLHIPLDIELYDGEGKVIPLQHNGHPVHHVLNVTEEFQTFIFDNVYFQPVPSLLREFSAPVKLDYKWSDAQLTFLMRHARNDFARWDAAQSLLATYIRLNVARHQQGQPLSLPLHVADAFRAVLLDEGRDPALTAQILTLPGENEIAELFEVIDPQAITVVREALVRTLATELADEFYAVYNANQQGEYRIEHDAMGQRALKNICLYYLAFGETTLADRLVQTQYQQANNMTDALAALAASVAAQLPCRGALLAHYDERWHRDGLVMDKWLMLQATSPSPDVLQKVRELLHHRSFTMSNPNRIRALIGAFVSGNPAAFHAKDGSGYQFLVEMLTDLNTRNPQVAARMIEPLIRLKRYDADRQALMRQALETLQGLDKLSGDLYEKITRALNA